jgi:hypothetical protein
VGCFCFVWLDIDSGEKGGFELLLLFCGMWMCERSGMLGNAGNVDEVGLLLYLFQNKLSFTKQKEEKAKILLSTQPMN